MVILCSNYAGQMRPPARWSVIYILLYHSEKNIAHASIYFSTGKKSVDQLFFFLSFLSPLIHLCAPVYIYFFFFKTLGVFFFLISCCFWTSLSSWTLQICTRTVKERLFFSHSLFLSVILFTSLFQGWREHCGRYLMPSRSPPLWFALFIACLSLAFSCCHPSRLTRVTWPALRCYGDSPIGMAAVSMAAFNGSARSLFFFFFSVSVAKRCWCVAMRACTSRSMCVGACLRVCLGVC